jgi:hypothetical protein
MAKTATPIFAQSPLIGKASLTSPTPVTSRANITGTTGLTQLTPVSVDGKRLDHLLIVAKGTTVAGLLTLWLYDGTTSTVIDEITIGAQTASTTSPAFKLDTNYTANGFNMPPTYQLYVSVTVANDLNVYAFTGDY